METDYRRKEFSVLIHENVVERWKIVFSSVGQERAKSWVNRFLKMFVYTDETDKIFKGQDTQDMFHLLFKFLLVC